jgi:hypothetical protein
MQVGIATEAIDALSQRDRRVRYALALFHAPATNAARLAKSLYRSSAMTHVAVPILALEGYALALWGLWVAWHLGHWELLWVEAAVASGFVLFPALLLAVALRESTQLGIQKGVWALREAAASSDNRLAPAQEPVVWTTPGLSQPEGSSSNIVEAGPVRRLNPNFDAGTNRDLGVLFLFAGIALLVFSPRWLGAFDTFSLGLFVAAVGTLVIGGTLLLLWSFQILRAFSITANEQGFRWKQPAFGLGRRSVQAAWQDVRAFITFRVIPHDESADTDQAFVLDTTTEALAWRITPKTPASVREAHERFVRMANEHVPLRDITASLKNLLESPETRSYEYAVTALSGAAPIPPAVRKVLTTPVRESHFLRGYLIVAAILLTLLIVAGLLLQSGLIPAGSF